MALIGKRNIKNTINTATFNFDTKIKAEDISFKDLEFGDIVRMEEGLETLVYIVIDEKTAANVGWPKDAEPITFMRMAYSSVTGLYTSPISTEGYYKNWPWWDFGKKETFKVKYVWKYTGIHPNRLFKAADDFIKFYKDNNLEHLGE